MIAYGQIFVLNRLAYPGGVRIHWRYTKTAEPLFLCYSHRDEPAKTLYELEI